MTGATVADQQSEIPGTESRVIIDGETLRYYFREQNPTTLELVAIDDLETGDAVASEVVVNTHYEDLPPVVKIRLKELGYRMVSKGSFIAGLM